MKRKVAVFVLPLLLMWVVTGCNIFSFTNPVDSAADYVSEGRQHLRDGEYAEAIESFTNALDENPNDAYARWGRAKAYLRSNIETADITAVGMIAMMAQFDMTAGGTLPFHGSEWNHERADVVYQSMFHVMEDLGEIANGNATNDEINLEAIRIDYLSSFAVQAMLVLRDTNADSMITSADIDLSFLLDAFGTLDLDANAWSQLTPEQQAALTNAAANLLTQSSDQILGLLDDLGVDIDSDEVGDTGLDISNLDSFNEAVIGGLLNL